MARLPKMLIPLSGAFSLSLWVLPDGDPSDLEEYDGPDLERVCLTEEVSYGYEIVGPSNQVLLSPRELFKPDDPSLLRGRFCPGRQVGKVSVQVWDSTPARALLGEARFEVRSIKIDYLTDYREMLAGIADLSMQLVLHRFAAANQGYAAGRTTDAATGYQRFAFLQSCVRNGGLDAALARISVRPHTGWRTAEERRSPRLGLRGGSRLSRQLASAARRVVAPEHLAHLAETLPALIPVHHRDETFDTLPNRFVKAALLHWRDAAFALLADLRAEALEDGGPRDRGEREIGDFIRWTEDRLRQKPFADVGHLVEYRGGNPVLERREGYREVLETFALAEMGAFLSWSAGERDVFGAGKRDVATLYEYWACIQLALAVANLCGAPRTDLQLLAGEGPRLALRKGVERVVFSGTIPLAGGRTATATLNFNRTFARRNAPASADGSWSEELRPDCSLRLELKDPPGGAPDAIWLHFDAKYRFEQSEMGRAAALQPRRADILKMHAYRDAIRRSAGAYVLYPGFANDPSQHHRQFHEVLPGVGAFVLRPGRDGQAPEDSALRKFLGDVVAGLSAQTSQHERSRYWEREIFRHTPSNSAATFRLEAPPADVPVLTGLVRSDAHFKWIENAGDSIGRYNLRANEDRAGFVRVDAASLATKYLITYGAPNYCEVWAVEGAPEVVGRDALLATGYPAPGGTLYFVLRLRRLQRPEWLTDSVVRMSRSEALTAQQDEGGPIVLTWANLMKHGRNSA